MVRFGRVQTAPTVQDPDTDGSIAIAGLDSQTAANVVQSCRAEGSRSRPPVGDEQEVPDCYACPAGLWTPRPVSLTLPRCRSVRLQWLRRRALWTLPTWPPKRSPGIYAWSRARLAHDLEPGANLARVTRELEELDVRRRTSTSRLGC